MTLTSTIYSGFAAIASALAKTTASPPARPATTRDTAPAAGDTGAQVVGADDYHLHVAFTPYGPEVFHFWLPSSAATYRD